MMQTIDISGLSPEAVRTVESLVNLLRGSSKLHSPNVVNPEEWAKAYRKWAEGQSKREITFDDGRECIYAGCGE